MEQVVNKKLSYVNFAQMVSETVCAEMLSRNCRSNLVGEVVHEKLSYVNLAAIVSERVCAEMLLWTSCGKLNGNLLYYLGSALNRDKTSGRQSAKFQWYTFQNITQQMV
ncbi:hypothetical protein AVEN_207698-1 [Araneus ventricosus]|uniref:Uncharacterized protein n=1 Tax=Araneus ventricosus TaxID=182803 RepID=A0A4Y2AAX3_ARAVE|nr:hypothetical protein AVEN_207698-1 [Araneus ventricosus]